MLLKASTFALIPALIIQGHRVKKNTPKLAEPEGQRHGQIGQGPSLSILIVGDSAAAGVGVAQQQQALLGKLLQQLQQDFQIDYRLHAKTGHRTGQVIKAIAELDTQHYDVVISSVGVNDVTQLTPPKKWIVKQQQLYQTIQQKFSPMLILATGVPPMNLFPALPNPLAWLFGQYAKQMNQQLDQWVHNQQHMQWLPYDIEQFQALNLHMAADGFHPSEEVYALWAAQLAERIKLRFLSAKSDHCADE